MSILAIAEIQRNNKTVAYRLVDTITREVKDATIESIYATFKKGRSIIDNIYLDNNKLQGRGWDINRLPVVNNGQLVNRTNSTKARIITIIGRVYQYNRYGYQVCSYMGVIEYMSEETLIMHRKSYGITNGDIIEINGEKRVKYIPTAEEFYRSKIDRINAKLRVIEQPYKVEYDQSITLTNRDLTHINIIDSVRYIKDCTFSDCSNLKTVELPEGLIHIGTAAFRYCNNLRNIEIPEGIKDILIGTFSDCVEMRKISLPSTLENIGHAAFLRCLSLLALSIPPKVQVIPKNMCAECESLACVLLHNGIREIGDMAFYECKSLEEIEIPDSVQRIGSNAFQGCTKLKSVRIPPHIKEIGDTPFKGCMNLKEIIIPRKFFFESKGLLSDIGTAKIRLY